MDLRTASVLIVPGINDSGPGHWQSYWHASLPRKAKVQQEDWAHPRLGDWVQGLEKALIPLQGPVVLVAHSLGCLTVAAWAQAQARSKVAAALLVAPPDPSSSAFPDTAKGFRLAPGDPLPFPALVVASSDDPFAGLAFSLSSAQAWGASFQQAGQLGHINTASNIGAWEQGFKLFKAFCQTHGLKVD